MGELPKLASVGDSIQCDVRHPYRRTITMKLVTPESVAYGNSLLMDPRSGWRLAASATPMDGFGEGNRG